MTNDLSHDQRMDRIATSLSLANYNVFLLGRLLPESKVLLNKSYKQKRLKCWFRKGKAFYIEYNIRLFLYLLFNSFDIVNSVDLDTLPAAYLATYLKRKVCVYDAHEYFSEVPEVVERPFVQKVWETVASTIIPRLDYCYTVCYSLADIFEKKFNVPFQVIRNVPFQIQDKRLIKNTSCSKNKRTILLYQGALNKGRGIEEILIAIKSLPDTELWLAGEGDLSQILRKMAMEMGLEDRLKFLGYLHPEALKVITSKADIGLNLLKNQGLNYYYSLANKFFDYIQAGLPNISMDFPEYQKINSKYEVAVLIPDLSQDSLTNAIQLLQNDSEIYRKIQRNCIEASHEFIWEKEAVKLIDFYEDIKIKAVS